MTPKAASQRRVAFSSIASNTGARSPGDLLMTCKTSAVAVSRCSPPSRSARHSASWRCRSAMSCSESVAGRPGEGLLTERTAGVQPVRRERVFMPKAAIHGAHGARLSLVEAVIRSSARSFDSGRSRTTLDSIIFSLASFGTGSMSGARAERRLAAILAVDVAGYSRLMSEDEEGTLAKLRAIRRELGDPKIKEHRGRIVKTTGDGLLVEFGSIVDAVRCAVEVQREMATRNLGIPPKQRIEFRMGINVGDIVVENGDIFGDGVNIAARLEALADPGGICASRVVRDQVPDKLDFFFEDMGERLVKSIARPLRTHRIVLGSTTERSAADA